MKLIVQIPYYNEASTLPDALASLPRRIPGIDKIEVLIIDDGSRDGTAAAPAAAGVDHIVRFPRNLGLAAAFTAGVGECVRQGADIIVNTDADNQYDGANPPADRAVVRRPRPYRGGRSPGRGTAELLPYKAEAPGLRQLGDRPRLGLKTPDATSGFRALTREAALRTFVLSGYSYTLETLIQAGATRMSVDYVPIRINPQPAPRG